MLLNIYIASVISGLVINNYKEINSYRKAKEEADKLLDYDELSINASIDYNEIYRYLFKSLISLNFQNLIPIGNIISSLYQICCEEDIYDAYVMIFEEMIEIINEIELKDRKEYYKILKEMKEKGYLQTDFNLQENTNISFSELKNILEENNYNITEILEEDSTVRTIEGNGIKLKYIAKLEE